MPIWGVPMNKNQPIADDGPTANTVVLPGMKFCPFMLAGPAAVVLPFCVLGLITLPRLKEIFADVFGKESLPLGTRVLVDFGAVGLIGSGLVCGLLLLLGQMLPRGRCFLVSGFISVMLVMIIVMWGLYEPIVILRQKVSVD